MGYLSKTLGKLLGYVPAEEREGIRLEGTSIWKVSGVKDFPNFILSLKDLVPPDSTLYLEGGCPNNEIKSYLIERTAKKCTKVAVGIIWPKPEIFHMQITVENLKGLAELGERHASPEIAIHVHVYKEKTVLLEWHHAPIYISKEIPRERVEIFSDNLQAEFEEVAKNW